MFTDLLDKVNGMWSNVKLFSKGITLFNGELQVTLSKHLLKTICTDITNIIFVIYSKDHLLSSCDENTLTSELRTKILSALPDNEATKVLVKLHSSLNEKEVENFLAQLDQLCDLPADLEIGLKKPDKKKDRQLIFNHRQGLIEQLRTEADPAMTLHLAVILLIQATSQCMVHAPGRCVPQIITYLKEHIPVDQYELLIRCQDLLVQQLKLKSASAADSGESLNEVSNQLTEVLPKIKELAIATKKGAQRTDDAT